MATGEIGGVAGWVVDVIDSIGAVDVGALIALENIFPPIPSEVILPFAGFSAARGSLNAVLAWVAATIGAVVGSYVLYGIGALVGYDRVHRLAGKRWFVLFGPADLARGERFFHRHGSKVVLLGASFRSCAQWCRCPPASPGCRWGASPCSPRSAAACETRCSSTPATASATGGSRCSSTCSPSATRSLPRCSLPARSWSRDRFDTASPDRPGAKPAPASALKAAGPPPRRWHSATCR